MNSCPVMEQCADGQTALPFLLENSFSEIGIHCLAVTWAEDFRSSGQNIYQKQPSVKVLFPYKEQVISKQRYQETVNRLWHPGFCCMFRI